MLQIEQATIDPNIKRVENKYYSELFMEFHKIILKNGALATNDVNAVIEFIVQLDDERKLDIDKKKHIVN